MSTDTRTVAEIMGWRARGGYGAEHWWWDADGNEITTFGPDPTPDDMLAWLRERLQAVHPGNTDAIEMWWEPDVEDDCYSTSIANNTWSASTIHAALEAAVRAVAAAS